MIFEAKITATSTSPAPGGCRGDFRARNRWVLEGCRSLGDFRGEERKDVQGNKIDGAGGGKPGHTDEEELQFEI